MAALNYRRARPADAPLIAEFQIAMARETEKIELDREICLDGVNAVFEDSSRGQYYVCETEGRVIGSALITYEWSDWRNGVVWWLQSVYVVYEMRGKGAFSGLYRYIKELAMAREDVRGLRLYVDKSNTHAQQVYGQLGMNGEHYQVFEWMK